jgi:hypothetical protein
VDARCPRVLDDGASNEPGADPGGRARGGPVRFTVAVELSDAGADLVRSLLEEAVNRRRLCAEACST